MKLASTQSPSTFDMLLQEAQAGDGAALGELLEGCRAYLHLLASRQLGVDLRPKLGASDLVQKTYLDVQQSFERFHGSTGAEFHAWIERILLNNLADCARQFRATEKRQVDREVPLAARPAEFVADDTTPSQQAIHREEEEKLQVALERLPEDYRRVVLLRNQEKRPFEEIGRLMDRSTDAAKKLWARAILTLEKEMRPHV